jgi:V-type ATPase 116kDa subunit family
MAEESRGSFEAVLEFRGKPADGARVGRSVCLPRHSVRGLTGGHAALRCAGRYVILFMAIFSLFTGLIYNEAFSIPLAIFGGTRFVCPSDPTLSLMEVRARSRGPPPVPWPASRLCVQRVCDLLGALGSCRGGCLCRLRVAQSVAHRLSMEHRSPRNNARLWWLCSRFDDADAGSVLPFGRLWASPKTAAGRRLVSPFALPPATANWRRLRRAGAATVTCGLPYTRFFVPSADG